MTLEQTKRPLRRTLSMKKFNNIRAIITIADGIEVVIEGDEIGIKATTIHRLVLMGEMTHDQRTAWLPSMRDYSKIINLT